MSRLDEQPRIDSRAKLRVDWRTRSSPPLLVEKQPRPATAPTVYYPCETCRSGEQIVSAAFNCDEEAGRCEPALRLEVVLEPLSHANSGRVALRETLQRVVELGISCRYTDEQIGPAETPANVARNTSNWRAQDCRQIMRTKVLGRLEQSVCDGELPEDADVEALCILCVSFLIGLTVSVQDGIPTEALLNSVALFVASLGFHTVRPAKRRHRRAQSVLAFVGR